MTEALKVLGQSLPTATTLTALYTVNTAGVTGALVSSLAICNHNSAQTAKVRVSIAIGGSVDDPSQYVYFDLPIASNDTFITTIGISLAATDVIRVYSDQSNVSFNVFGVEVSP